MRHLFLLLCFFPLGALGIDTANRSAAASETLVLVTGGHLEGKLINPDENPRKTYQFKLASGAELAIDAEQVKEFKPERPEVAEFERIRGNYPDTEAGQFALAKWCRDHELPAQRTECLQRVIEINPDHEEARRLLGYNRLEGTWLTEEERMTKLGYERDKKGKWKLPQEIQLDEQKDRKSAAESEWIAKVNRWRVWLNGDRRKQARDSLLGITDPNAVLALAKKMQNEGSPEAKQIYIEALAHIATPAARATLAVASIQDADEDIRLSCLDELAKKKEDPTTVQYFINELRDKQNPIVNRAAVGLARMKDPSAIGPLINALITEHKETVSNSNPNQMSTTFGTKGTPGGGLSMNKKATVIVHHVQNQAVLDALVAITHENFYYNVQDWHAWFVAQQSKGNRVFNARGDR